MKSELIKRTEKYGEIAEIKRIFYAIESSMGSEQGASLMITSGQRGEGKTTMTAGLASFAAQKKNSKVLVVDMNWYKPELHNIFDVDQFFDATAIEEAASIDDLIKESAIHNLWVLPAVKSREEVPEDSSFDSNHLIIKLLSQARKKFNYTFVDTSAMFPTNRFMIDPAVIASNTDGTALVTLANVTPREFLKKACIALENSHSRILGVIVNQWKNPITHN